MTKPGARVLTVIACGPNGEQVLSNGNVFLRDVSAKLRPIAEQRADYHVTTASSVDQVASAVESFGDKPSKPVLQLVGHGGPGELELGRPWVGQRADNQRFYLLDNNSRELALLTRGPGAVSEVRLVACQVGAYEGEPLLFALSRALACDVRGATVDVGPEMFDEATGLYEGPFRSCEHRSGRFASGGTAVRVGSRAVTRSGPEDDDARVTFDAISFVRRLALAAPRDVEVAISPEENKRLRATWHAAPQGADGGGVVDLAFKVTVARGGEKLPAYLEVLSNQRCRLVPELGEAPLSAQRWHAEGILESAECRSLLGRYERAWRSAPSSLA
ncbi:MAG: DUF4347 domain-containing protein [Kofleriaceae bacterium]